MHGQFINILNLHNKNTYNIPSWTMGSTILQFVQRQAETTIVGEKGSGKVAIIRWLQEKEFITGFKEHPLHHINILDTTYIKLKIWKISFRLHIYFEFFLRKSLNI